jgi:hypothetical protein
MRVPASPQVVSQGVRPAVALPHAASAFQEAAFPRGPGHCGVCGQQVYRLGWHQALWGAPNLQVIDKPAHLEKCAEEAAQRSKRCVAVADPVANDA